MEPTRVTVDEIQARMERGEPFTFIDTRKPEDWEQSDSKLPGALRIPVDEIEAHLAEIPRDRTVIAYCTCLHEASSARVVQTLGDHGWKSVHPLYGGFEAWQKSGGPVESKQQSPKS